MPKILSRFRITNFEQKLSSLAILYLMIGLIFAFLFALYYRWPWFGYFSPGFFAVLISWPFQAWGFIQDLLFYGLAGKPI